MGLESRVGERLVWPSNRGRRETDKEKLDQSIAYDNLLKDNKISDLIMVYDEANLFLFEKPQEKRKIKKV